MKSKATLARINGLKKNFQKTALLKASADQIHIDDYTWWIWAISIIYIISALAFWDPGYYIVMGLYIFQLFEGYTSTSKKLTISLSARITYLVIAMTGFWEEGRFFMFLLLMGLTYSIVFKGKCIVSSLLQHLPWNQQNQYNTVN